jgi:stage II sporulation protein D
MRPTAEPNARRFAARLVLRPARWAGACALAAAALSCRCGDDIRRSGPVDLDVVPVIRVRLTAAPVRELAVGTTGGYRLQVDGQVRAESGAPLPRTVLARTGSTWRIGRLTAPGRELIVQPAAGSLLRVGRTRYRGQLRLLLDDDGERFHAVNHLDVESYLAGVLPKELYPAWSPETYRAVAVAARTFAMYHVSTLGTRRDYDLGDTQASQVYGGVAAETSKSWAAVRASRGIVLAFGEPGRERIFLAQYSSCCGGRVNGAYVIRNAHRIPPLAGGQICRDCAASSRYRWPPVTIDKGRIHEALVRRYPAAGRLGGLAEIRVHTATDYGRAVWVDVLGPTGRKVRLRAEDIRLALIFARAPAARRLYSMNCRMRDLGGAIEFCDGRGFGHGVGLCQWGAEGKARKGWTAEQILAFYYPGARLFRVY